MLERFSLKSGLTAECVLHSVDQPVGEGSYRLGAEPPSPKDLRQRI